MAGVPVPDGWVVITQEQYDSMAKDVRFLQNLMDAGVDNWDGYHYGWSGYDEDDE